MQRVLHRALSESPAASVTDSNGPKAPRALLVEFSALRLQYVARCAGRTRNRHNSKRTGPAQRGVAITFGYPRPLVAPGAVVTDLAASGDPGSSSPCFLKIGTNLAGSGTVPRGAAASTSSKKISRPPGTTVATVRPGAVPMFWNVCRLPRGAKTVAPSRA